MTSIEEAKKWWDDHAAENLGLLDLVGATHQADEATAEFMTRQLTGLVHKIKDRSSCLDAGCGVGLFIPFLLETFESVVGLDFSQGILDKVDPAVKSDKRVTFKLGSLTDIPLPDGSVPNLFCKGVLQCLSTEDVTKIVKEFYRVLRPQGCAIIHFKNETNMSYRISFMKHILKLRFSKASDVLKSMRKDTVDEKYVTGVAFFRPYRWYFKLFEQEGFKIVDYFSHLFFTLRYMEKRGKTGSYGRWELVLRRLPGIRSFVKPDGIDFFVLIQK